MSFNLIESIRDLFNNEFVNRASSSLGESHGSIQKALGGIIPALLGGALVKANSGDGGSVLNMARNAIAGGSVSNMLTGDTGSLLSRGMDMLSGLFGNKTTTVSNAISNYAGIREPSASSLMGMSAPLVLGRLGEHAQEQNMNASDFTSFLTSQKDHILSAMPSGLNLGSLLGMGSLASMGNRAASMAGDARDRATNELRRERVTGDMQHVSDERRKPGVGWVLPLVLLVLAALAVWYFAGRGKDKSEMATRSTTTDNNAAKHAPVAIDNTSNNMAKSGRTSTKVRLANGTELEAYAGGVEEKLVNCLDDAACKAGKDKWFDFDNINFETGSANLTSESQAQVKNIAAVLNAYPKAKIKIGGYTDKTGNAASNQKLSQQRADAVMNAIKAAGARPEQLTGAEGYGSSMAKMPASASDEERRADRRISVQLREK